MAHRNGFSLIETIVSVAIASLAALAFFQAQSIASSKARKGIENYQSNEYMALLCDSVTTDAEHLDPYEVLKSRYKLDNTDIQEALESYDYGVSHNDEEQIELITSTLTQAGTAPSTIRLQKFTLSRENNQKSFFRLTMDGL